MIASSLGGSMRQFSTESELIRSSASLTALTNTSSRNRLRSKDGNLDGGGGFRGIACKCVVVSLSSSSLQLPDVFVTREKSNNN